METKTHQLADCEIKFDGKSGWKFEGYASKFGGIDSYKDTIHKGAYEKTLEGRTRPVMMRYEHKAGMLPPGKWEHLSEDSSGLVVAGELTKGQSLATDIRASMEHGTLGGLSIGFRLPKGGAEEKDGIRHIKEIDLVEISIVQNPADSAAIISGMKTEIDSIEDLREAERFLRDVDVFSISAAKCFVGRVKTLGARDARQEYQDEIAELKAQLNTRSDYQKMAAIIKNL